MKRSFTDKCFKDEKGDVVLGQVPNLPIIVWIISSLVTLFAEGKLYTLFEYISFGALFTWSWLELFDGVNYLRRFIGLLVLIGLVYSRIH